MPVVASSPQKYIALKGVIFSTVILIIWVFFTKVSVPALFPSLSKNMVIFISRVLFWFCVVMIWLYASKIEKLPFALWPEKGYNTLFYIASIVLMLLTIIISAAIIAFVLRQLHLDQRSGVLKTLAAMSAPLKLFAAITAAIAEELIFRMYMIPRIQQYFKSLWPPVLISGFIFGLGHVTYGTVGNALVPLIIGLLFGFYYQKYRNIKVLMICHFLIDFSALFLAHS